MLLLTNVRWIYFLKMLYLCLDTIRIGHNVYSMVSIPNEITVQKERKTSWKIVFYQKSKTTTTKQKGNILLVRAGNRNGPLVPQSNALTLDHWGNWIYRLKSNYLTA